MKTVAGESKSVTEEITASRKKTTLPTILVCYALKEILNADEFCLFYQTLPSKTMDFKGQKCSGGKTPYVCYRKVTESDMFERGQTFALSISIPAEKLDALRIIWRMSSSTRLKV